jgi:hypothetical protein
MLHANTLEASLLNFSYIFTLTELVMTFTVLLISSLILSFIFSLIKLRWKGLVYWVGMTFLVSLVIGWKINTSCRDWDKGLNGQKIEPYLIN